MDDRVVSYAQNREDVILASFFDDDQKGFYVDVGANHPVNDSVTKYFYDRGWRGINIEPIKEQYDQIVVSRPEDINLQIGISDKAGSMKLRVYEKGDGLSTFSDAMKRDYEANKSFFTDKFHEDSVQVKTLEQIFNDNNVGNISFLKVDVEGYESAALKSNNWVKYRPEVLCIEANHLINDWHPLLEQHNYEKAFYDGLNEYFVAKEATDRLKNFSYVKGIIGRPIISFKWNQELIHQQSAIRRLEMELQFETNKTWEARREVAHLQAELVSQRRIRNLAKSLLRQIDAAFFARINALNKPKKKHASRLIPLAEGVLDNTSLSIRELLALAKQNDHDNFYNNSTTGSYSNLYMFKTTMFVYKSCRSVLKSVLKFIRRVFKRGGYQ